jgi:hypothetical protein
MDSSEGKRLYVALNFLQVCGLWCLMPLSTIFQLYRCVQFQLVEETGVPGENYRPAEGTDKLYHIMLYRIHLTMSGIRAIQSTEIITKKQLKYIIFKMQINLLIT